MRWPKPLSCMSIKYKATVSCQLAKDRKKASIALFTSCILASHLSTLQTVSCLFKLCCLFFFQAAVKTQVLECVTAKRRRECCNFNQMFYMLQYARKKYRFLFWCIVIYTDPSLITDWQWRWFFLPFNLKIPWGTLTWNIWETLV